MAAAVEPKPSDVASEADAYDCFLSYSRHPDEKLAQTVRQGLAGLAKPWYRRRALRVFLDTASLPTSSGLQDSIVDALERSRFFILLASPDAAASPWVEREVAWWREHRDPSSFLIADCGAGLNWNEEAGDFSSDAKVPASLRGWFPAEPTWTDLSWAEAEHDLSLKDSRFSTHVADLAAPLRSMSKDALVGEDIRQHRRSLRLAWGAAGALLVLAVAATVAAIVAVGQRREALSQRDRARARELAALAEANRSSDPLSSLRNATESLAIESTPEGVRALRGTLAAPLRRVFNVNERINELQFSPDGRHLAHAARSGVSLWDLRTGELSPASRSLTFVSDFSFDASGRRLAIAGQIGAVNALRVRDLAHPSATRTFRFGNLAGGAISPDGRTVALASYAGALALREVDTGRTVVLDRDGPSPFDLQFSPDGRHLAAFRNRRLEIWDATRPTRKVAIASGALLAARFTSAGTVVGVAGDGTVTTWSLGRRPLRRTRIAFGPDPAVAVSPDGRLVAVGSGSSVVVWDLLSGGRRVIGTHPGGGITAVAFGPGARSLASAAEGDAVISIWDLQTAPPWPARGGSSYASILTASAGGALIAGADDFDSAVAVWPRHGGSRRVFHGGDESILAAGFMRDGRQILTISDDGVARFVDATTGRRELVRRGLGPVQVAALSPDRRRVAIRVDGGPLRVWRLAGGAPVTLARRTRGLVYSLSVSADGHVAAANRTRRVDVWSVRGGPPTHLAAPEAIDRVEFAPSGEALAAASARAGAGVFLWRSLEARARPVLLGRHRHFVSALAFSPDGSGVASAGDVGPVYLWTPDGASGITLAESRQSAITFDPTGTTLAMSGGTLRVLSCKACGSPARLMEEAERLERRGGLP
jgi:WD40 repeat protein